MLNVDLNCVTLWVTVLTSLISSCVCVSPFCRVCYMTCMSCRVSQFTVSSYWWLLPDKPAAANDEEIYDDVDSQSVPPLPPLSRYSHTSHCLDPAWPHLFFIHYLSFYILFYFILSFYTPAFQTLKAKPRLTRWTQRSRRRWRKRRRSSGKSLKLVFLLFLWKCLLFGCIYPFRSD